MKTLLTLTLSTSCALAEYYRTETIPLPEGEVIEVSSIALMPDQKVAISGRRGSIWVATGCYDDDVSQVRWTRFAQGLHEPLGMHWKDGSLYVQQRSEYTRATDTDGDGKADNFENICDDWGTSGNYHEYVFGSTPDRNGDVWAILCLTGSGGYAADFRGWGLRITPDGQMYPEVSGIRSPGGLGYNAAGDLFYTDNQGPWNGSSSLKWMKPGGFMGSPSGNKAATKFGLEKPPEPKNKSRMLTERLKDPRIIPPAVILPHGRVGQSPTAVLYDDTKGKFGPFQGQVLVGEQTHSQVQRVDLEKVNGLYQGAVFPFLKGYASGVVPMRLAQDGTLFVGGTNRGWGSRGPQPFSFERTRWTGEIPFETETMKITPKGFRLTFTQPADEKSLLDPSSYQLKHWTYIYQKSYGSPEVDQGAAKVTGVKVLSDGRGVELTLDRWERGHVYHLEMKGVKSAKGKALWHPSAYYTVNEIPES